MLEFHPLANLFPLIEGMDFDRLVEDVRANGLLDKIVILDGKILDGRNRYRAAIEAGVLKRIGQSEPAHFRHFNLEAEGDPLIWVLSKNLHRRHLNDGQRAAVAAEIEGYRHGGKRGGQDANVQLDRQAASDLMSISPRSTATAAKVKRDGTPELFAKVKSGELAPSVAVKLLTLSPAQQLETLRTIEPRKLKTVAKQVARGETERRLGEKQRALPTELFGLIYADPATRFEPYSRETGMDRAADNHYPTQTIEEIMALPVGTLAAPDTVLACWSTVPMLCETLRAIRFWGFEYKSHYVWDKVHIAPGYWNRNRHEILIIATRGKPPAPAPGTQWDSIIVEQAREHSRKPDKAYEMLEEYYPTLPKIELNARMARPGWKRWGNEAPPEQSGIDADIEEQELIEVKKVGIGAHEITDISVNEIAAGLRTGPQTPPEVPPKASGGVDINGIIRKGYASNTPLIELVRITGLPTENAVKQRAKRMGLGDKERQRAAVSAANARRAGA